MVVGTYLLNVCWILLVKFAALSPDTHEPDDESNQDHGAEDRNQCWSKDWDFPLRWAK